MRELARQFPIAGGGKELQSDRILFTVDRLAVHHPRARLEIPQQRSDVESFVRLPRPACHYPGAPRTDVFRHAFLRGRSQVQAGQIDRHFHGRAMFATLRRGFHRTAQYLRCKPFARAESAVAGGNDGEIITPLRPRRSSFPGREQGKGVPQCNTAVPRSDNATLTFPPLLPTQPFVPQLLTRLVQAARELPVPGDGMSVCTSPRKEARARSRS
jgi:hypothetical protein